MKTARLRGHLVWIPMLATDNLDAAIAQISLYQDERVFQYWDGERLLGQLVSQTLKLSAPIAWDIYLLYSPEAVWKDESMPVPDFWMHQLDERSELLLDRNRLMTEVQQAIDTGFKGK